MADSLEVAIAAGGTAGHINPALALAEELTKRGHHVTFFGQTAKLEGTLVPQAGFDFSPIRVTGFDRSRPWTLVSALVRMGKARRVIGEHFSQAGRPDVAVGFGAYVELPLMSWCEKNGVPYVLHEQNSVPGLANKTSARGAATVCVSLPVACSAFKDRVGAQTSLVVTGNPVRQSVINADAAAGRTSFGVPANKTMLLVFGGSLGARHLNEGVVALKDQILAREDVFVIHSTGKDLYESVVSDLALTEDEARRWRVMPYIDNMGEALAASDLVLSRAGASSIAEIAALAVPSILVPYPQATADHQTTNARYLVDAGAAVLVPDARIGEPEFSQALLGLLDDPDRRSAMRASAKGLGQDRAAVLLAEQVEIAARGR